MVSRKEQSPWPSTVLPFGPFRQEVGVAISLITMLVGASSLQAASDCETLRNQRDQLAAKALQAEMSLVLSIRRRLCPQVEALAEQANANTGSNSTSGEVLDYGAYIRCRQQAEVQLRRTRSVLYRNRQAFSFYTPAGARLARETDELTGQLITVCLPSTPQPSP
jgi:hypothetical protein